MNKGYKVFVYMDFYLDSGTPSVLHQREPSIARQIMTSYKSHLTTGSFPYRVTRSHRPGLGLSCLFDDLTISERRPLQTLAQVYAYVLVVGFPRQGIRKDGQRTGQRDKGLCFKNLDELDYPMLPFLCERGK